MALLFLDGFDHYATADGNKKWEGFGSNFSVVAGAGRSGGGCLRVPSPASSRATNSQAWKITPSVSGELIVGFAIKVTTPPPSDYTLFFLEFYSAGAHQCGLMLNGDLTLSVYRYMSINAYPKLATSSTGLAQDTWRYLEVKIRLHDTLGSAIIKIDGTEAMNASGLDTASTAGATDINAIYLGAATPTAFNPSGYDIDDFYICDTTGTSNNDFLGDIRVKTLYPTGAGANSQLVGSDGDSLNNYALVDEGVLDTADYVGSATTDQKDTYIFGDVTNVTEVKAVQSTIMAGKSEAGARSVASVVRHGGTDYNGADKGVSTTPSAITTPFDTNPGTGTTWTADDVNNAEFGVKVRP